MQTAVLKDTSWLIVLSPFGPVVSLSMFAIGLLKEHSKLHCAKYLERWMLSGKSENELVPKFRVIFAAKLYFLQIRKHETW